MHNLSFGMVELPHWSPPVRAKFLTDFVTSTRKMWWGWEEWEKKKNSDLKKNAASVNPSYKSPLVFLSAKVLQL
jgi:hypothetical protein